MFVILSCPHLSSPFSTLERFVFPKLCPLFTQCFVLTLFPILLRRVPTLPLCVCEFVYLVKTFGLVYGSPLSLRLQGVFSRDFRCQAAASPRASLSSL